MCQRFVFRGLSLAFVGAMFALVLLPISAQAKKGKKYALLVGVTEYEHSRLGALKYTVNDVDELEKALLSKASGFDEVRVLSTARAKKNAADSPTAANVQKALVELVKKGKRHDTILVALAGHGVQPSVKDPEGKGRPKTYPYFCPTDAAFRKASYSTGKCEGLLLLDDLFREIADCGATNRLVLIDACRNEIDADSSTRNVDVDKVTVPKGVGVMFSCRSGERAWETKKLGKGHGVFFYNVVQGLKGEAKNKRGQVTWESLTSYVRSEVAEMVPELLGGGAEQTPHGITNLDSLAVLALIAKEGTSNTPIVKKKEGTGDTPLVKSPKSITNSIKMKLVRIPAGEFMMGSPKGEKDRNDSEGPQRKVKITGFYMGVYEMTQGEYEKVMGKNPSYFSAEGDGKAKVTGDTSRFPVERVSYEDALEFCKKLSAREAENGRVYRLPTEAEWEYACRAGTTTPFHYGESLSSDQANFDGNYPYGGAAKRTSLKRTCEVGSFKANVWGLYDMHGNVLEWCSDWYDKDSYDKEDNKDPQGPNNCTRRVLRGGCYSSFGKDCRSADRDWGSPGYRDRYYGFRVVCAFP